MKYTILSKVITMLKSDESYTTIISYLFDNGCEEKEIIKLTAGLGIDKELIKGLLVYDFGLDYETIMEL